MISNISGDIFWRWREYYSERILVHEPPFSCFTRFIKKAILQIVPPFRHISSCKKVVDLLINITPRKSYANFVSEHYFLSTRILLQRNWPQREKIDEHEGHSLKKYIRLYNVFFVWKTRWHQLVNSLYIINFIRNDSCTKKGE